MHRSILYTVFPAVLLLAAAPALAQAPELDRLDIVERAVPNGPVAIVDGTPISREDFLTLYRQQLNTVRAARGVRDVEDSLRLKTALATLGELLHNQILLDQAEQRGITVGGAELEKAYEEEIRQLQETIKRHEGVARSEEEILERTGRTRKDIMEELREALIIEKMEELVAEEVGITITDKEIQTFYEEHPELFNRSGGVHIKQVFVRPKPNAERADAEAWASAEAKIKEALQRIRAGESFAAVARDLSDGQRAGEGGDLGIVPSSAIPPFYEEPLSNMEPGDLSDIIRSEHGFHIIRLLERKDARQQELEDVRDRIRRALRKEKKQDIVDDYAQPVVTDPERVMIFLDLEKQLRAQGPEGSQPAGLQ